MLTADIERDVNMFLTVQPDTQIYDLKYFLCILCLYINKFFLTSMLTAYFLFPGSSIQLSSLARDMCTNVRIEAFNALGKMQRVSEGVLLQSLSKKVIKPNTGSGSIIKGEKVPPKLIYPCAAGIFVHGIEDEFHQVLSFLVYHGFSYIAIVFFFFIVPCTTGADSCL